MPITPLPDPPERGETESTFVTKANAFIGALPTFVTETNALAVTVAADKDATETAAAIAPASIAAANFKGNWSDLTGALTVPASVYHLDKYWTLASDLADVTAKTPGTDVEWLEFSMVVAVDYQEFTASGTWTKPSNVTVVYVEAIGGGGSGAAVTDTGNAIGGGGAGGSYGFARFDADALGATVAVVVGAGGASVSLTASTDSDQTGNSGGDSTFDGLALGAGGGPGTQSSAPSTIYGRFFGGSGGYSSFGNNDGGASLAGGGGGAGTGSTTPAGSGGASVLAGNGGSAVNGNDADATGISGTAPGGGGGVGGCRNVTTARTATSGAGAAGRVRVWAW